MNPLISFIKQPMLLFFIAMFFFCANTNKQENELKINQTPAVVKEKLIENIVARHKGNVVLLDFWATWCSPCMKAFKEMKPLKAELKSKGVVFVYLTNGTSPKALWEEKIRDIGGEHYYLSPSEWGYMKEQFGFTGIPSYLIYDKTGMLKQKFTGFRGNNKMRKMIEEELR